MSFSTCGFVGCGADGWVDSCILHMPGRVSGWLDEQVERMGRGGRDYCIIKLKWVSNASMTQF